MKNKYQEALNKITPTTNDYELIEATKTIQQLIDKETPMKPNEDDYLPKCKECNFIIATTILTRSLYCNGCGQKIDWSEDEESQPH